MTTGHAVNQVKRRLAELCRHLPELLFRLGAVVGGETELPAPVYFDVVSYPFQLIHGSFPLSNSGSLNFFRLGLLPVLCSIAKEQSNKPDFSGPGGIFFREGYRTLRVKKAQKAPGVSRGPGSYMIA